MCVEHKIKAISKINVVYNIFVANNWSVAEGMRRRNRNRHYGHTLRNESLMFSVEIHVFRLRFKDVFRTLFFLESVIVLLVRTRLSSLKRCGRIFSFYSCSYLSSVGCYATTCFNSFYKMTMIKRHKLGFDEH